MAIETAQFEPLPMRRRELIPVSPELYRIVSLRGETREVNARTAYEAFKQSGMTDAIRIERKAITRHPVLTKSRFTDEAAGASAESLAVVDTVPPVARRKSPVVTADDLDSLMKALENEGQSLQAAEQQAPAQVITNPTGVEVHGDGFDEIIPAQLSTSQMGVVKQSEDGTISTDKPALEDQKEIVHEQELTQDEINKLLNG